jgi:hypothetical protein
MGYAEDDAEGQARLNAFRQELAGPGWIEGQTLKTDIRWSAGDVERAAILAGELVGRNSGQLDANDGGPAPAYTNYPDRVCTCVGPDR